MAGEIRKEVASRRAEVERSGMGEHVPIRHADAELKRDDHCDEKRYDSLLREKVGSLSREKKNGEPSDGDSFDGPQRVRKMVCQEVVIPSEGSPIGAGRESESSESEALVEILSERCNCFRKRRINRDECRVAVSSARERESAGDEKQGEHAFDKQGFDVPSGLHEAIGVKENDSEKSREKHDRRSLGEESDGDGDEHDAEILPVDPFSQAHNASPREKKECRNEKRVVVYIGRVHRKFRLKGDDRREKRADEGIEPKRSRDKESEKHGDCPEEDGEYPNSVESDKDVVSRERRLESARNRMVEAP